MNDIHNWPLPDKEELFNYLRFNSYRSEQYKLFYVATPKVACTSIKWWFASLEGHSQVLRGITDSIETDHDLVIHETFYKVAPNVTGLVSEDLAVALTSDSYFRFAVVRNPYKRIFSAWQSKLLLQEPLQIGPYLQCNFFHHPIECADDIAAAFEGFLEHLLINEASSYLDAHWTPQATLLRPDLINYALLVKIENAQELSQALAKRLGGYIPDPFANRRKNESILPYLPGFVTERSAELIRTLYAEDFETFGYDRQPPEAKETLSTDQFNLVRKAIVLIRGRHQRMGEHNVQKAALNQAIADYEDQIANHNVKIAHLNEVVSELDGQMMILNQGLAERDGRIAILNQDIVISDLQIHSLNQVIIEREKQMANIREAIVNITNKKDWEIFLLQQKLNQLFLSRSWRLTAPLRKVIAPIKLVLRIFDKLFMRKIFDLLRIRYDLILGNTVRQIRNSVLFDRNYYLASNLDVQDAGMDPAKHYLYYGWKEHRDPSLAFSTSQYLFDNPDVAQSQINPLIHYLRYGQQEGRSIVFRTSHINLESSADFLYSSVIYQQEMEAVDNFPPNQDNSFLEVGDSQIKSMHEPVSNTNIDDEIETIKQTGLFDESFYLSMNTDLQITSHDTIRHYCERGWREGRNPTYEFDTSSYLATYSDIRNAGINPFWHYVVAGASEMRHADPDSFIGYESDIRFGAVNTEIKLLAFYSSLDWALLRSKSPSPDGNTQRHFPHDVLGFYDPFDWQILHKQAQMAKSHGLYGFCFQLSHDVNNGIVAGALEVFLAHDDIDFRYCVQIELFLEEISESIVDYVLRAVCDKRYISVEGMPVIVVLMSGEKQYAYQALRQLRERLAAHGIARLFLIGRWKQVVEDGASVFLEDLCDAVMDLPLDPIPGETGSYSPLDINGVDVVPYCVIAAQGIARIQNVQLRQHAVYHVITLGRNNHDLFSNRQLVYARFHPRHYRQWLDASIVSARIVHSEDRRFVFVNAWNDWNQGLVLEPSTQIGFGCLNETTRALLGITSGVTMPKVSVIVPNYNHECFLRRRLDSIYGQTYKNIEVILLDDSSSDQSCSVLDQYADEYPDITSKLYNKVNTGGVFRQWAKGIKAATGDLVWIAESDDFCDENFLDILVRCFDDEAVMLAYSKCVFVNRDEVAMPNEFQIYVNDLECADKWNDSYTETAHIEVKTALGIKNTIPNASGVLFRRPTIMPLLEDELWLSMRVAGDWIFYLHILRGGKIAYSVETVNFFRRYEGSVVETMCKNEICYRELGLASRTVHSLYNVPLAILNECQRSCKAKYDYHVGRSDEEFLLWFDRQSIIYAGSNRLPNVMVSTMGFIPGGAEIFPIRLANEFKSQGVSVLVLSTGVTPREDGIRRLLRSDIPIVETSDVEAVKRIIHDYGIEVLNTHQWHVQKYPLQTLDVFDELTVHIASLHGMIEHGAFGVTEEQLRITNQKVSAWVYTAEKNLGPFKDFGLCSNSSTKFVKLPNGMQLPTQIIPIFRAHMAIPDGAFLLCCVSRAIPDKGWAESILAVERARELSGRDIRLILVGNGPIYEEYCRLGTPDFVYLVGFSENSVGHYAAADMGIMLTKFKSESFPLTIVDCLFAGKPYIASDVGDIRNMLTTSIGVAGEVIELENWEIPIEKAAQVIAAFATEIKKYQNALNLVSEIADRYRIDIVAEQYIRLFKGRMDVSRLCTEDL